VRVRFVRGSIFCDVPVLPATSKVGRRGLLAGAFLDNGPRDPAGDREKAAQDMVEILKGGRQGRHRQERPRPPTFEVAGKTGTSQKIDPRTKQYTHEKYIASFVGFAPADDAKMCIAVVLDEPQGGSYTVGAVAAPVVGRSSSAAWSYVK